jgi:membrane protease YdiL (CAAX protease family)
MGANNKGNSPNAMSPIFTNFAAKLRMLSQTPSTNPLRNLWGVGALLLTIIVFSLVGLGLSQLMGKILYGLTPEQTSQLLNHPSRTAIGINVLRWGNLLQFLAFMAIPGLLITLIAQYKFSEISGFAKKPQVNKLLGATLMALGMIPLVALSTALFKHLPLGDFARVFAVLDTKRQAIFEAMLDMETLPELFVCIFILALMPAIFEEYVFRGLITNMATQSFRKRRTAIIFQAFVFATIHFSPFEFAGIFAMGLLFGIIYTATGSLYYSILAHFIFNASTVIVHFFALQHFQKTGVYFNAESFLAQPAVYIIAIPVTSAGLFLTLKK